MGRKLALRPLAGPPRHRKRSPDAQRDRPAAKIDGAGAISVPHPEFPVGSHGARAGKIQRADGIGIIANRGDVIRKRGPAADGSHARAAVPPPIFHTPTVPASRPIFVSATALMMLPLRVATDCDVVFRDEACRRWIQFATRPTTSDKTTQKDFQERFRYGVCKLSNPRRTENGGKAFAVPADTKISQRIDPFFQPC